MKKIITTVSAVAVAVGAITFVGCGGPAEDPNANEGGETVEPETPGDGENKDASGETYEAGPEGGSQAGDGGGNAEGGE